MSDYRHPAPQATAGKSADMSPRAALVEKARKALASIDNARPSLRDVSASILDGGYTYDPASLVRAPGTKLTLP